MDLDWNTFEEHFIHKKSGSNLKILVTLANLPNFCVAVRFEYTVQRIIPCIGFFCTSDGTALDQNTPLENILPLNSVNVIPAELYLPAGLIHGRLRSWVEGKTNLGSVPLNSTEYNTILVYRDHK
jgi:hypothetical protein